MKMSAFLWSTCREQCMQARTTSERADTEQVDRAELWLIVHARRLAVGVTVILMTPPVYPYCNT